MFNNHRIYASVQDPWQYLVKQPLFDEVVVGSKILLESLYLLTDGNAGIARAELLSNKDQETEKAFTTFLDKTALHLVSEYRDDIVTLQTGDGRTFYACPPLLVNPLPEKEKPRKEDSKWETGKRNRMMIQTKVSHTDLP